MYGKVGPLVIILLLVTVYSADFEEWAQTNNTLTIFGERLDSMETKVASIRTEIDTVNLGITEMSDAVENMDMWLGQILTSAQNKMIFLLAFVGLLICVNIAFTVTIFNFVLIPRLINVINPPPIKLKKIDWNRLSKEINQNTKKDDPIKNKEVRKK